MNIATVVSITPSDEAPYASAHGLLYPFLVAFDNNISGKVNAKAATGPAYKVGDLVGYEITGNRNGMNQIKVDKKAAEGAARPAAAAPATRTAAPAQAVPGLPKAALVAPLPQGQTVGMAINNAVRIIEHNAKAEDVLIDLPKLQHNVEQIAAVLITASRRLETGQVVIAEDVQY